MEGPRAQGAFQPTGLIKLDGLDSAHANLFADGDPACSGLPANENQAGKTLDTIKACS